MGCLHPLPFPVDLGALQSSHQWWLWAFGVVFLTFFASFFVSTIDPVSDGFLDRFWPQNGAQINQESLKNCPFSLLFLRCVFCHFFWFLFNFRGLRTSGIVLAPTAQYYFREIAVFVFGLHSRWILAHFDIIFDPKTLQKGLRDPVEKRSTFGSDSLDF